MWLFKKSLKKTNTETVAEEKENTLPDDKKSITAISIKRTNSILIFTASVMIITFVIVMLIRSTKNMNQILEQERKAGVHEPIKTDNDKKITNKIEGSNPTSQMQMGQNDRKNDDTSIPYIPPVISFDPDRVEIQNQKIGEETFKSVMVYVLNNPIKVIDAKLTENVVGLNVDKNDCTSRSNIDAGSSCVINITWNPTEKTDKSFFLRLKYNEMNNDKLLGEKEVNLPIIVSSIENIKPENKEESSKQDDDFFNSDTDTNDNTEIKPEIKITDVQEVIPSKPKKEILPDDCKKYASKAYDFSGVFIGWVQGDNKVFAPNCSRIIGQQEEDGMIKAAGTGAIIGKGSNIDSKKSEEKRVELTLPLLDEIIKQSQPENVDFSQIMKNRELVKANPKKDQYGKDGEEDLYQITDKLGIKNALMAKKVPFSITGLDQLSSKPKDERYVLRQSKPIPAVLNRAIFLSSSTGNQQEITATVEKNVFGGNGRTIIVPAGTQLIGIAEGNVNNITAVEKININWNRLIRPDGAEFNLGAVRNYSADAQGRAGVPGKNDTGYMKQLFLKPLLYSALPVAMESLFPTSSQYVTRVTRGDNTYNTITKGADSNGYVWNNTTEVRNLSSRDKIKAEVEQNFKSVMQKLIEDSSKQTIPFTVPAGTRIQVFLNKDIMLTANDTIAEIVKSSGSEGDGEGKPKRDDIINVDDNNIYKPVKHEFKNDSKNSNIIGENFNNNTNIAPKEDPAEDSSSGGGDDSGGEEKDDEEKDE